MRSQHVRSFFSKNRPTFVEVSSWGRERCAEKGVCDRTLYILPQVCFCMSFFFSQLFPRSFHIHHPITVDTSRGGLRLFAHYGIVVYFRSFALPSPLSCSPTHCCILPRIVALLCLHTTTFNNML